MSLRLNTPFTLDPDTHPTIYRAKISSTGTILYQSPAGWIDTVGHPGTGSYSLNFAAGEFSAEPVINITVHDGATAAVGEVISADSISADIEITNVDNVLGNRDFYVQVIPQ